MFVPADPSGAGHGHGHGEPSFSGWPFWNLQKNQGLSSAAKNYGGFCAASTSTRKNEGCSNWISVGWRPRSPVAPAPEYNEELADLYLEAARRLPIADFPYLATCISNFGLAVGLADPVTNIILTTINAFAKAPSYVRPMKPDDALEKTRKRSTFAAGARNSLAALVRFLTCYFRNLTEDQAAGKCLDMAGHHLPLAVLLVEVGCWGCDVPRLQPDGVRTKLALQKAARCCRTNDLVPLMTRRYPPELLYPVLDDLRGGQVLSTDCVYRICDLLRPSWSPQPTPPAPVPGIYRDSTGNVTTIVKVRKDVFATTTISKDLVTTTTITSTCSSNSIDKDGVHLSAGFGIAISSSVHSRACSLRENPIFLPLLKTSLLDTVHGFYIDALGMLPSRTLREHHLIRAVLAAGHCYGPLDPVSNIILNSIWYDAVFPLSDDVSNQIGPADILDARSLSRVESRSLDGIVAFVVCTHSISEQEAVALLCQNRFNLSYMLQVQENAVSNLASAALVAKHPQPAAFRDFLKLLTPDTLDLLRSLIPDKSLGHVLSDDALERLKKIVAKQTACVATSAVQSMVPVLDEYALETWTEKLLERRSIFKSRQDYVRTMLEKLLLDYGRDNKGHLYKLGTICGVTTGTYRSYSTCYHVNFLVSMDVPTDSTRSWELFFAEFWNIVDTKVEPSTNVPFCCPLRGYFDAYSIRCVICDYTSCKIAHPSCGEHDYFTGNTHYSFPVHHKWGADLGGMLESDFIYFDGENDEELAKILSEQSSSWKKPRAREEPPSSHRNTKARTGAGFGVPDSLSR